MRLWRVQSEELQQQLRRLRAPPNVWQQEVTAAKAQMLARANLGRNHITASRGTQAALGSVMLQLLLIQLSSVSRQPMFRQPVPWRFVNVTPPGSAPLPRSLTPCTSHAALLAAAAVYAGGRAPASHHALAFASARGHTHPCGALLAQHSFRGKLQGSTGHRAHPLALCMRAWQGSDDPVC